MTSNFNDISHIEAYLKGEMNATDRQAFEAQLATDEQLQRELAAYRQLFDGFQGFREKAFEEKVTEWTQSARVMSGETSGPGKVIPMNQAAKLRSLWKRVAVAASFTLLLGMAAAWWASQQYSDLKIVQNVYSPPLSSGTMGEQNQEASELEKTFERGHQFFQKGNYTDAVQKFDAIVHSLEANPKLFDGITRNFYLENAKWTKLLAQFANGDLTDEQYSTALDNFANDPASDYTEKAKNLKKDLNSFWRKIGR